MSTKFLPTIECWYRSRDGGTVHREGCRRAVPGMQWRWANDRTGTIEGLLAILPEWTKPCKICFPKEQAND